MKKMNLIRSAKYYLLALILISCSGKKLIYLYPEDKSNCVTILNKDEFRYVIPGKVTEVPEKNYAKLSIKNTEPLGDGIWICWLEDKKWEVTIHDSELITNNLDTLRYTLKTQLPEDERGIPHETKFRKEDCAVFSFHLMRLSPNKGAIVEIRN